MLTVALKNGGTEEWHFPGAPLRNDLPAGVPRPANHAFTADFALVASGGPGLPKIGIDNRLSDAYTVIEVKSPDRVGLLYLITRTLASLGLDIASARIATEIDHAYDTFYVHDREGRKVEDPSGMERAREGLEQALVQPL